MKKSLSVIALSAVLLSCPLFAAKKAVVPPEMAPKPGAPAPPYSPGVLIDGTLYVAGEVGRDPKTGEVPDKFEDEVKLCLNNIGMILKAGGMTFDNVVTVNVYMTDLDLFQRMNSVYVQFFKQQPRPARTTVQISKLAAPKVHVEINMVAKK